MLSAAQGSGLVVDMTSGGARSRSGPPADPKSGRSAARGLSFSSLPSEGRLGGPPAPWPLSDPQVFIEGIENGRPVKQLDLEASEERKGAEEALWAEVWTYPQAVAWERERWRWNIVAMWVRTFLTASGPEAKAADKTALHRFGDQLGLTPAGLRDNGWAIVRDELGERRAEKEPETKRESARERRLRAVANGDG